MTDWHRPIAVPSLRFVQHPLREEHIGHVTTDGWYYCMFSAEKKEITEACGPFPSREAALYMIMADDLVIDAKHLMTHLMAMTESPSALVLVLAPNSKEAELIVTVRNGVTLAEAADLCDTQSKYCLRLHRMLRRSAIEMRTADDLRKRTLLRLIQGGQSDDSTGRDN